MNRSTNINRSPAGLLVACSLALGGPADQAADAPAAARAPLALAKGTGVPEGESGNPREQSAQQALEVREILQTAESLDPLDREKRLACLARAARRFPANEDVARNLSRALGPKPQVLSNRFWGHALLPVSAAEIRTVREATKTRAAPWTAAELLNPPLLGPDANPQPPIARPNVYE